MKTMKTFQEFLTEKWAIDLYKGNKQFPIYMNPTSSDFAAMRKSGALPTNDIRFIAVNGSKTLFIWHGFDFIHSEGLKKLQTEKLVPSNLSTQNLNDTFCGECELISGSLTFKNNKGMDSYFGDIVDVISNNEKFYKDETYMFPDPYKTPHELLKDIDTLIARYKWVGSFIDEYETKSSLALLKKYYKTYKPKDRK